MVWATWVLAGFCMFWEELAGLVSVSWARPAMRPSWHRLLVFANLCVHLLVGRCVEAKLLSAITANDFCRVRPADPALLLFKHISETRPWSKHAFAQVAWLLFTAVWSKRVKGVYAVFPSSSDRQDRGWPAQPCPDTSLAGWQCLLCWFTAALFLIFRFVICLQAYRM